MVNFPPEYPDKPPQDSCLLVTLVTVLLVIAWLGVTR